jgi:putative transposase
MTKPSPLLFDTYYHICVRGVNHSKIFVLMHEYDSLLNLIPKYIEPFADLFAYCILQDHFHMMIKVKSETENMDQFVFWPEYPNEKFSDFLKAYTQSMHKTIGGTGRLFQYPFGRMAITSEDQFKTVIAYIHQNPHKHKVFDDFRTYKYSSYNRILSEKPGIVKSDKVLEWFSGRERYLEFHNNFVTDEQSKCIAEDDFD